MSKSEQLYYHYWGKAKPQSPTETPYHLLPYHSLDVAAVGQVLLREHAFLRQRLAQLMQLPEDCAVTWCVFLLGLHDLGKFAESFQQLRPDLRQLLHPEQGIEHQHYALRHDSLGKLLWQSHGGLQDQLLDNVADDVDADDFIQDVLDDWLWPVLGHHGWPPDHQQERLKNHFRACDVQAAQSYWDDWQALIQPDFYTPARLADNKTWAASQKTFSWLLAGIAVLCDWLGSDSHYFTYHAEPMPLADYWEHIAQAKAAQALTAAGVLPKAVQSSLSLQDLFPFIAEATPLQAYCEQLTLSAEPQLFILEDVTGAGKTEAALILAQHLLAQGQGKGVYIGLPTMATANAMYTRMGEVYGAFYVKGEQPSLILSHSARHLSPSFQATLLAAQPENQNYGTEETISAQCNRWLADNRKKALLADVGIGTVDQALLSVMPARHQSLRLLGLLNKVLILDEVHAYDAYTSQLLKELLSFHAAFGGSVILLSATLTRQQRDSLISAFYGERYSQNTYTQQTAYPLLTHTTRNTLLAEQALPTRESVRRRVGVHLVFALEEVLALIVAAVQAGKSVCWIPAIPAISKNRVQSIISKTDDCAKSCD